MTAEERYKSILDYLEKKKTVSVSELSEALFVSESTIRKDLTVLASRDKLIKVHGGATVFSDIINLENTFNEEKKTKNIDAKESIAKYAAETIREDDFVFIDAGTTTLQMIEYIDSPGAIFVTNGFNHASKLAKAGYKVYIAGGLTKKSGEAVIGGECIDFLKKFNFTKCFMGANGISLEKGFTTSEPHEAFVKRTVIENSVYSYILADHSKFEEVFSVNFCDIEKAIIITDYLPDKKYLDYCTVRETNR